LNIARIFTAQSSDTSTPFHLSFSSLRIRTSREIRHIRLGMRGLGRAVALVGGRHLGAAVGDDEVAEDALEEGQGRLGLVVGDLVPALVDAREAEVAVLPALAVLDAVNDEGRVARRRELGAVRVVQR
jgi:hypothetical protein